MGLKRIFRQKSLKRAIQTLRVISFDCYDDSDHFGFLKSFLWRRPRGGEKNKLLNK
jgi:hypothetical protein